MSDGSWRRAGPLLLLQPDPPSKAASLSNCNFERLPAGSAETPGQETAQMVPSTHMILSIGCAVAWLARVRIRLRLRREKSP